MPIIYNGVTLTDIVYNGVALDKVVYNGVEVFTKAPAIIREPAEGEYYLRQGSPSYYWGTSLNDNSYTIMWQNISFSIPLPADGSVPTSYNNGTYTYYMGATFMDYIWFGYSYYGIYRIKN